MVRRTYRRRATFQGRSIRPPWAGPASPQPPAMRAWTSGRRRGGSALGGWRRGGRPDSTSAVARATVATACSNAASVAGVGRVTPLTLRTYWRAAASISSVVAGGSRPRRVVMLRHILLILAVTGDRSLGMASLPVPPATGLPGPRGPGQDATVVGGGWSMKSVPLGRRVSAVVALLAPVAVLAELVAVLL